MNPTEAGKNETVAIPDTEWNPEILENGKIRMREPILTAFWLKFMKILTFLVKNLWIQNLRSPTQKEILGPLGFGQFRISEKTPILVIFPSILGLGLEIFWPWIAEFALFG